MTSFENRLGRCGSAKRAHWVARWSGARTWRRILVTFGSAAAGLLLWSWPAMGETAPVPEPGLPDGRAWELVSPANKNGALIEPIRLEGGVVQAAAAGSSVTYVTLGPITTDPAGNVFEGSQVVSERNPAGWSSQDIATPHETASGAHTGEGSEYRFFSLDLSLGLVEPYGATPLSPEATEKTMYLRHVGDGSYQPLVTAANVPATTTFGNEDVKFVTATPDLGHVALRADVPLTPGAGEFGLYEWAGGHLVLVSILPDGSGASEAALGSRSENVRHAMSDDGSRVVWANEHPEARHLYLRDVARRETIQLDVAQGAPEPLTGEAVFQTASSDGSRVFFTDTERLTADSTAEPKSSQSDLYECEVGESAGKQTCKLSDLTVDHNPGESAAVQGMVLGTSEEGSDIYFVATGALAAGAVSGMDNLYVRHNNGTEWAPPRLVAVLAGEDEPDWGPTGEPNLGKMTSRVSPNGRYVAFMSTRSLTGYDNQDANSGQPDEEVFLYDANTSQLTCVSCVASGARPVGMFDAGTVGHEALIDRPVIWGERWLSGLIPGWTSISRRYAVYQSRYLSDTGRLFFNSTDALVPRDVNETADVYAYEPGGVGGCSALTGCVALISSGTSGEESAFLDASESGGDVFFLTAASLASPDHDIALDVYDAHECTPAVPCLAPAAGPPPPCVSAEACRPNPPPQPDILGALPSATLAGAGNLSPPASKARVKAKKHKRKTRRHRKKRKHFSGVGKRSHARGRH